MKTALFKDGIKEIVKSYKRFISILLIVLLGVGFFAGLRAASPDMKATVDQYFDDLNVMDIQVVSTLGLTDDDVEAIKNVQGIENAEGSYQADAIVKIGEEEVVVKLETFSNNINKLNLVEGKLPENQSECVVEERFLQGTGHSIGDTIEIDVDDVTNDDGETEKLLKNNKVTIVGTVKSPLYISTERGSTKLGSGVIDYYVYIPKENINIDMYTNIYVAVSGAKDLNSTSNKYSDLVSEVEDNLEAISEERREARYNELYDSANSKIQDAQKELDDKKKDAEKELDDAQKEIDDGKKEIEEGKAQIESNRNTAYTEFANAEAEIENGWDELESNKQTFENSKKEAEEQIAEYQKQKETLEQTNEQLNTLKDNLKTANSTLEKLNEQLESAETDEEKTAIQAQITEVNKNIQVLQATITGIESELKNQGITDIKATIQAIESGIEKANSELSDG